MYTTNNWHSLHLHVGVWMPASASLPSRAKSRCRQGSKRIACPSMENTMMKYIYLISSYLISPHLIYLYGSILVYIYDIIYIYIYNVIQYNIIKYNICRYTIGLYICKYVFTPVFHVKCKRGAAPGSLPVGSSMAAIGISAFRQGLFGISWDVPPSVYLLYLFVYPVYIFLLHILVSRDIG